MQLLEKQEKRIIIDELDELFRNREVNIAYYNLIFMENALLMHHLHTTFRPWLIHTKPYKNPVYENKDINDFLAKDGESFLIPYSNMVKIHLSEKTLLKNLKVEIILKEEIKGLLSKKLCFYKKQKISLLPLYENLTRLNQTKITLSRKEKRIKN